MGKLPRLNREPLQSPSEGGDREIWQPRWKCFCCHDSGYINLYLVRHVIPDYDPINDKQPLCHATGCSASDWACTASEEVSRSLDWRFNDTICDELDRISREDWRGTMQQQSETAKTKIAKLAQTLNLRQRDRTMEEQQLAERKHWEVSGQEKGQRQQDDPTRTDESGEVA